MLINAFVCKAERCRSPIACGGFGYCRERNFDGHGMSESEIQRRRRESAEETISPIAAGRAT